MVHGENAENGENGKWDTWGKVSRTPNLPQTEDWASSSEIVSAYRD